MNAKSRAFCARLGIAHPIVQAPMAGGGSTPALAAEVSEAGGLGFLGAAYLTPAQIGEAVAEVRKRTRKPFGVNLFCGGFERAGAAEPVAPAMLALLARHHAALGLPPPEAPSPQSDPAPAQFEALLAARVPVFSSTFGFPAPDIVARMKAAGTFVIGTATTVEEGKRLAAAGADAIQAQGAEAGGHRGTFAAPFERAMIGLMALLPALADAVEVPVIASGGIMDGRGIVAAEALGAAAVALGTAFLVCEEAGVPDAYKTAILRAAEDETTLTRAFSGRPARGIVNAFLEEAEASGAIAPFPTQNALTRPMRNAAAKAGDVERLSLWAGQGVRLARRMKAAELMRVLVKEIEESRRALAS
ncbi:MAG: nitronate monooxygenase [Candidatus Odyssella sp.]|nr:nitronate monooxygenase [Candidatus Odyssella sp.]